MPAAQPPIQTLSRDEYLGDGLTARFDGYHIMVLSQGAYFAMGPSTVQAFKSFLGACTLSPATEEADVWHEGSKKHYRAVLLRELTLDEVYQGLK